MGKLILYYKYIAIAHPGTLMKEQKEWCERLGLKGRVLIAHEGINGTLGGTKDAIEQYKKLMAAHPLFSDIDFKESEGEADYFPRLQIKVKKQIVNFGVDPQEVTAQDAGTYLSPEEAHQLMSQNEQDVVVFDARNNYESKVGAFENAVCPEINHFRELPQYIDNTLDQFKNKRVIMYCTGGIRCERATAYLKLKKVAKEVYHIKGGIHRYVEAFPQGFFKGKNYVFDGRVTQAVTNDILAHCEQCKKAYDDYSNCINAECNKQIIVCPDCIEVYHNTCSTSCMALVKAGKVNIRTIPHKIVVSAQR